MALNTEMASALGGMDAGRIHVEPRRCISVRNRNAACQRCISACAGGALRMEGDAVAVDAAKCMGCGTCANACPTDAIVLERPSAREVAAAFKRSAARFSGYALATCERAARALGRDGCAWLEQAGVCVLPCLGHVDESLLVEQAARHEKGVVLVHAGCASCEHESGGRLCGQVCADAAAILAAFGSTCEVEFTDAWPSWAPSAPDAPAAADGAGGQEGTGSESPSSEAPSQASDVPDTLSGASCGTGRLFSPIRPSRAGGPANFVKDVEAGEPDGADGTGSAPYWKVGDDGTLSHCIPLARTRLYNCLSHLGAPRESVVKTRLSGRVEIDARECMSCRMCAVFCPTGALHKSAEGKPFGLFHRPALCMQCRCCEQICPKGALHVEGEMPVEAFLSREAEFIELPEPGWTPNTPTSMYDRFADMIGRDLETGHF